MIWGVAGAAATAVAEGEEDNYARIKPGYDLANMGEGMSVEFPISIERDPYRGRDPRRQAKAQRHNLVATELERKINKMIEANPSTTQIITYGLIAAETGVSETIVRDLCFSIDCGHTGFTVTKRS